MIAFIASAATVLILALWVARGFFRPIGRPDPPELSTALGEERFGIYRSMLDLEEDFRLGKVSNEDHGALRSEYEAEALEILRQSKQEQGSGPSSLTEQLEKEIAAARLVLARRRESE